MKKVMLAQLDYDLTVLETTVVKLGIAHRAGPAESQKLGG